MRLFYVCVLWAAWNCELPAAEPATLPTLLTERGKLVVQDDLSQPLAKPWTESAPIWEAVDGAWKATHRKPYPGIHGPVAQRPVAIDGGAIVQLSFKLEGKARATVHFNKKNGHLCRTILTPTAFYVVRRDSGGDKGIRLGERELTIAPDVWHTLVMEVCGNELLATLDGKETIFGARDDLDQPKTSLILESAGGTAWFKDLRVWEATPKQDWPATKSKLNGE